MSNPLLTERPLPAFSNIKPEDVEPALNEIITTNRQKIESLLTSETTFTWDNLVEPIETLNDRLNKMWSPVSHLNSVVNTPELRKAYHASLPKLTEYSSELSQHPLLYRAIKTIHDSQEFPLLNNAQQKVIENELQDFHLAGVDLPVEKQSRFRQLKKELSELTSKFEENVLDATDAWSILITDQKELAGLPEHALTEAANRAKRKQKQGWLFTLAFPSYHAVITYADNRELRHHIYQAYVTRASDEGPDKGKWDNSQVMFTILDRRLELAKLLGFKNYAQYSLQKKMAKTETQVLDFLYDLAKRAKPYAEEEFRELTEFANTEDAINNLMPWDIAYYSEKLQHAKHAISQEALRPYFPENKVLQGMFTIVEKLYGMTVTEITTFDTWHNDVRLFAIYDENKQLRGKFYIDLYAREQKRGGAWMDECVCRRRIKNDLQIPVAFLTCNFSGPTDNQPALFTHDEVITLFHEFGHGLHHLLTQIDYAGVSGINGVPWDGVELPSQFFENWCWEREAIDLISGHYQSGETLPDDLFQKMLNAKNFQSAMQMLRQIEFSLFDFRLHQEFDPEIQHQVQKILDDVRLEVAVVPVVPFNRFQHGFTHIFAGGYGAGYYSYKWAEVLSADAYSKFEEQGIFDQTTGRAFLHHILEQGGSGDFMDLFIAFRGRKPTIDALLRHSLNIA